MDQIQGNKYEILYYFLVLSVQIPLQAVQRSAAVSAGALPPGLQSNLTRAQPGDGGGWRRVLPLCGGRLYERKLIYKYVFN